MYRLGFLFCFFFFNIITSISNQPVRFTHYSASNGLPNDYVLSIIQDKDGFIWFGTHLGITRYDGHTFRLFQPEPQKNNSLSFKHVSNLYCDLHGNVWVTFTENALNRMDTQTERFFNYSHDDSNQGSISGLIINGFFEDSDSVLWISTRNGLNIYNNQRDNFYSVLPKNITNKSYPNNDVLSVTNDTLGNIWFLTTHGIGQLNKKRLNVVPLSKLLKRPDIDGMQITSMTSDRKSKLWFATRENGLFTYNIVTGKLTNCLKNTANIQSLYCDKQGNLYVYSYAKGNVLNYISKHSVCENASPANNLFEVNEPVSFLKFIEDKTGNVWISSSQGLDMFSEKTGIVHYKHYPFQAQSLTANLINCTFVDRNNNLWVSIYRKGVDKADLNQKSFHWNFTNPAQTNNVLLGSNITSVMEDSHNYLWIGATSNSIIRYDRKTNTNKPIQVKKEANFMFSALFEDSEGDIWVGNYNDGVERINPKTLKVSFSADRSESGGVVLTIWGVRKFTEDKDRNIWFVSSTGVHKWERKTNKVIPYSALYDNHVSGHGFYRTIYIDKTGLLWTGSLNGGLASYNTSLNKIKRFQNIPGDKTSISGNGVYAIYEESDTTFLVGTTMGLNRFNKKTERFSIVQTHQNIDHFGIYTIIPDSLNNLWMATDNGLICLNKKTLECSIFNEGDGLLANEFNTTASCYSRNGEIYLGCPKGLISFNPGKFTRNPGLAHPTITQLQVSNVVIVPGDTLNGRVLLRNQIWATHELMLNYDENDFTLQFSAMHFATPENNKFWYKLEGFKDEWIATDANRRWASFTGLPPGHYIFKLKATNNDGLISRPEDEAILKIFIKPPFWKTLWFMFLSIFLIVCTIFIYIRRRINRLNVLNKYLELIVKERTKDLQEINVALEEHQEEISLQKEELVIKKEALEQANEILKTKQEEIILQNLELDNHRNRLEKMVEARTSELVSALNKAEESDKLKSSFLANMSHEIRTPMNAILGFSTLLRNKEVEAANVDRYLEIVVRSGESLLVLINDILDLSKIQSNQMSVNLEPHKISPIFKEVYELFGLETLKKGIQLKFNISTISDDLTIVTDAVRLKQVILNLVSNALKFTHTGYIEYGVYEVSDQIIMYVKDTGIGIPPKIGNAIFERFFKLEENSENLYRGAGLGLAISKSIIELLGGKIWYESKENIGTTFYFTHSLNNQQLPPKPQNLPQIPNSINLTGINILIAEDEETNYQLLLAYLIPTYATVLWAKNGKEACEMVDSNNIDLVLMDIKMPVMGGLEASKLIKQKYPKMPIIAQTAFTFTNRTEILRNTDIDSYLSKPINRDELLSEIRKHLRQK